MVTVLIVDDDQKLLKMLRRTLAYEGFHVVTASDGREALTQVQAHRPDVIVLDWLMPGLNGIQVTERLRAAHDETMILMLTARDAIEDRVEGLESGADDYLIKPFDREELKCHIKIGERIIDLEHRLTRLASTDALTGALNRRAFTKKVEIEIHRATRENATFSFLLADIDYFKKVNDTFGHQAGDFVLQKFTERLSGCSRPYDFIGRYGGEEFVMCLPRTDVLQARSIAERLRREVEDMSIQPADVSQSIQITASIGVASFRLASKETVDSITMRADEAMYKAKREGRNRVCVGNNR